MKLIKEYFSYLLLPIDEIDPEKGKILWLIRLRWLFLLVQFIFVIPYLMLNENPIRKLVLYVGLCSVLLVFNTILYGIWKKASNRFSSNLTFICLIVDLSWFSILYWFLSLEKNIHIESLYFIHSILGAILLNNKKSNVFYFMTAFNLLVLQVGQFFFWNEENIIKLALFNQVILFLIWMTTRSVNRYVLSQREKFNQMKLYAEKMDRLRAIGALTAGFSHEFASPLNTVRLRLDRMKRKELYSVEDIFSALEAVEDCEDVIKKINQSQFDKRDFVFQKINIEVVLKEIIDNWKVDHPNARVELVIKSHLPNEIQLPLINFSQGILNVLDNSSESTRLESLIKVEINVDENRLYINLSDNGEGFSKEILDRFGEPFVTTKKDGTGLGLYSFQLFAESIGGSLKISNLFPKGASVVFAAPLGALKIE